MSSKELLPEWALALRRQIRKIEQEDPVATSYTAGLFDADASLKLQAYKDKELKINYQFSVYWVIKQLRSELAENRISQYLDGQGISYGFWTQTEGGRNTEYYCISIDKDCYKLTKRLAPVLSIKRRQAKIYLNKIYPIVERSNHTNKIGLLKCVAWSDVANVDKGGNRGKYNLLYFEDEWDIRLDLEKHGLPPNLREYLRDKSDDDADRDEQTQSNADITDFT